MSKFVNAHDFLSELERIYDAGEKLTLEKREVLQMAVEMWKSRMGIEMTLGFMGSMVKQSYDTHVNTVKEIGKVLEKLEKWHELDNKDDEFKKNENKKEI